MSSRQYRETLAEGRTSKFLRTAWVCVTRWGQEESCIKKYRVLISIQPVTTVSPGFEKKKNKIKLVDLQKTHLAGALTPPKNCAFRGRETGMSGPTHTPSLGRRQNGAHDARFRHTMLGEQDLCPCYRRQRVMYKYTTPTRKRRTNHYGN